MPMQWNDQADARLFANVLKLHVVKLDYPALARAMGNGVTPKAISHRISKIKEKAKQYGRDHAWAFDNEEDIEMTGRRGKGKTAGKNAKGKWRRVDDEDDKKGLGLLKEEWVYTDEVGWEKDGGVVEEEEVPMFVVRKRVEGLRVAEGMKGEGSGMAVEMPDMARGGDAGGQESTNHGVERMESVEKTGGELEQAAQEEKDEEAGVEA